MKNEQQLKQELFDGLFESRVTRYTSPVDGKYVDTVLVCNNESLQNFFKRLYIKHKVKYSMTDFISECQYWTYMAVTRFQVRDEGSFEEMIDGTDKANIGRLVTAIKNTVEPEIIRFLADGIKFSTKSIDGEVHNTSTSIQFSSLDMIFMSEDGANTNLVDSVSSDMAFWGEKDGYIANQFIQWFEENKGRVLTNSQLQLLNNLQKVDFGNGKTNNSEIQLVTGFNPMRVKEYLERIKTRVLKVWEKEKASVKKTQLALQVEKEVTFWTELFYIMSDADNLKNQNKMISNWFVANLDTPFVTNLVYDNIMGEDIKDVVSAYSSKNHNIKPSTIYKLISLVEERLDKLQVMDTSSVKFYKSTAEMGYFTPEVHKAYAKYLKEFKEQPIKVFKLNEDGTVGELLREEKFTKDNKKKTKQFVLTPSGVTLPVNMEE